MVELVAGGLDRRVRTARLTADGEAEYERLERVGLAMAESFLGQLNTRQQRRLVEAMADVERLLTSAMVDVREVDPAPPGHPPLPPRLHRRAQPPLERRL